MSPGNLDSSLCISKDVLWASLVAQLVKNLPAVWETWVQSLGWEDPPEKGKELRLSLGERNIKEFVNMLKSPQ